MIKNNIDILILILLLIFDNQKYLTINNYCVLLIILFYEFYDNNYIENYYPTSSNNSQVLYNMLSVFNEKKARFKNLIIEGDFVSEGTTNASGYLNLQPQSSNIINFSNGWKIDNRSDGLEINNKNKDYNSCNIYIKDYYSGKDWLKTKPAGHKPPWTHYDAVSTVTMIKNIADNKIPRKNPVMSGNVTMKQGCLAMQARGQTLIDFNPFKESAGGTTWFYGCGIEMYKRGRSGVYWSVW